MRTDEDLRQEMISTATAFRFDQSRLDATTIARAGQHRRRRGRLVGAVAAVAVLSAGAGAILTQRADSPDTVVSLLSDSVYLVPTGTAQNLVLRRSSQITPSSPVAIFNAFYGDGDDKRIAVLTTVRDGLDARLAGPALATSSGFWMTWRPQTGVEVSIATVGMSREETEALVDRLGVDPSRGPSTYGLVTMPTGFHFVGDERDTNFRSTTLNVYAPPGVNIAGPQSQAPRADVSVGHASDVYREIDRIIFDERRTISIRGHEAEVTRRPSTGQGSIVTVTWFEQPDVLANVTTYNMATDDAIAFARSLQPVTLDEWNAHRASARG
jgi:hypothetical protein